jgi:hypothetical protein
MRRASLDWRDAGAVSEWLGKLTVSLHDMDAVAQDMLRSPRERELGPVLHARSYGEAWSQVRDAIAYARAAEPEPDGGAVGER